ncbi:MAG: hypothetical protein ABIK13_00390 [Patescibacteria group bacterium]
MSNEFDEEHPALDEDRPLRRRLNGLYKLAYNLEKAAERFQDEMGRIEKMHSIFGGELIKKNAWMLEMIRVFSYHVTEDVKQIENRIQRIR